MPKPKRRPRASSQGESETVRPPPPPRNERTAPGATRVSAKTARRPWRVRAAAVFFGLGAALVLLGLVEGALRLLGSGHSTSFFVRHASGRGWTVNDRFHKRFYPAWGPGNSTPFFVPDAKPSNTVRIFVLGESAALGTPSPAFGFARMLEVMLRRQYPERNFEIGNAAMRGINSHLIRPIAGDCARQRPDLFIVYAGNNELVGLHGVGPDATLVDRNLALSRLVHALRGTRLGQWLSSGRRKTGREQDIEYFRQHHTAADDPQREPVFRNFSANLAGVCDAIEASGAPALLLTVASNLRDFPPLASRHKAELGGDALASWNAAYLAGMAAEDQGRFEEALKHFETAARTDDHFAELHFRLGRCHRALGHRDLARVHFVRARDWDALPFRAERRLNDIIRRTASERAARGVTLLDVEQQFAERFADEGGPGEQFFLDHVHFRLAGDYQVAQTLFAAVTSALGPRLGPPRGPPVPSLEDCAAALGYNAWEEWQIESAISQQNAKPPFLDQMEHRLRQARKERHLQDQAKVFSAADLERARAGAHGAVTNHPGDWQLRQNWGTMSFLTGDYPNAVTQLQQVVDAFPQHLPARFTLANALQKQGRTAEAIAQFKACLRVDGDFQPARQSLAAIEGTPRR